MAPTYKVTYFNVMALGEPIRYLLSYGGVDFEDKRLQREEWPALKNKTPFGKVPILEVDGKRATQCVAICRYLAQEFGLAGKDKWQNLQIDSVVDTVVDIRTAMSSSRHADEATKAQKIETFDKETFPFYLTRLDELVKENGGYFVDGKLSWADLYFAAFIDSTKGVIEDPVGKYPNLKTLVEKVWALPNIKAWREKRPQTPF